MLTAVTAQRLLLVPFGDAFGGSCGYMTLPATSASAAFADFTALPADCDPPSECRAIIAVVTGAICVVFSASGSTCPFPPLLSTVGATASFAADVSAMLPSSGGSANCWVDVAVGSAQHCTPSAPGLWSACAASCDARRSDAENALMPCMRLADMLKT